MQKIQVAVKAKVVFCLLLASVMTMSLLSGCASQYGAAPLETEAAGSKAARNEVIVAVSTEPATLDPCQGWGHGNTPLIQSTLIKYNEEMQFENDLALDYSLDETGRIWTFHLRGDAKFTDGKAVTAQDVVFTFETAKAAQITGETPWGQDLGSLSSGIRRNS